LSQNAPESAAIQFFMIGHDDEREWLASFQHNVATALSFYLKA
jgi:hypothetical protein